MNIHVESPKNAYLPQVYVSNKMNNTNSAVVNTNISVVATRRSDKLITSLLFPENQFYKLFCNRFYIIAVFLKFLHRRFPLYLW